MLEALALQTFPLEQFEVVIIDDGSENNSKVIVDKYSDILTIRYQRNEHTGNRSKNRNTGIVKSNSPILLFLDGDIIPEVDFVEQHYNSVKDNSRAICMGQRFQLNPFNRELISNETIKNHFDIIRQLPAQTDERCWYFKWLEMNGLSLHDQWFITYSNNISIWKDFYLELGGFDSKFTRGWGAEDIELGYRAYCNDGKIMINKDIVCYHIYHDDSFLSKKLQLKSNLEYFYNKYLDWETELFTYEHFIWPINYAELRFAVITKKHLLSEFNNIKEIINHMSGRTINFGVIDPLVINNKLITCHLLSNYEGKSENSLSLLGTKTNFNDKEFDLALVSENYALLGKEFFELVVAEASRVSKRIFIASEKETITEYEFVKRDGQHFYYRKNPKVKLIVSSFDPNHCFDTYYMLNLAFFLEQNGVEVALEISRDLLRTEDIFETFLSVDPPKRVAVHEMLGRNFSYYDYNIPTIMDTMNYGNFIRAFEQKFLWGENYYPNYENIYKLPIECEFNTFLYRKKDDSNITGKPSFYLPIGIDVQKLNQYLKERMDNQNETISFVYIQPVLNQGSEYFPLINAFKKTFEDLSNVKLTIVFGENSLDRYNWLITRLQNNHSYCKYIEKTHQIENEHYKNAIKRINNLIRDDARITLINQDLGEDEILQLINHHDYLIDLSPGLCLSPFVLFSAGLGKKVITATKAAYKDYLPSEFFIELGCLWKSGIFNDPPLEDCYHNNHSKGRHFLYKYFEEGEIAKALLEAFHCYATNSISEASIEKFINQFDWNLIAEKFINKYYKRLISY